jgi:hypothetical protein
MSSFITAPATLEDRAAATLQDSEPIIYEHDMNAEICGRNGQFFT